MIKHHPSNTLLESHAKGDLPLSMAIALAAHCELCPICQAKLTELTTIIASAVMEDEVLAVDTASSRRQISNLSTPAASQIALADDSQTSHTHVNMAQMLANIMAKPADLTPSTRPCAPTVQVKGMQYTLPHVFKQQLHQQGQEKTWQGMGNVSRMRLDVDEKQTRASLLHIGPEGEIPHHTHKGFELTLLLAGEFSDDFGAYVPGDFMILDGQVKHSPKTTIGCLCYTILDAPLYFTKGFSKLLNPIGELIY